MKKGKLTLLLGAALLGLSSCGFFGSSGYTIDEVSYAVNSVGDTVVTITYTDSRVPDTVFTLPHGETGAGISGVSASYDSEKKEVTITVSYDDGRPDFVFTYPAIEGNGIDHVVLNNDETTGQTESFYFVYTDGEMSDTIVLPTGNGIKSITFGEPDPNDGSVIMTITMDDGTVYTQKILKGDKGDTGNGIDSISTTFDPTSGSYTIEITYTSGEVQEVSIDNIANWYYGQGNPNSLDKDANGVAYRDYAEGSFFVDTLNRVIYIKVGDTWVVWVDFINESKHTVTFHLEGGSVSGVFVGATAQDEDTYAYEAFSGSTIDLPDVVAPSDGLKFAGWWTSAEEGDPNAAQFTDLTPVERDIDLYARYEAI